MKRIFCSLKNFFSDIFVILPKQSSVNLSKDIIFFSKTKALESPSDLRREIVQSACGVFCLQMIFSFFNKDIPLIENLSLDLMQTHAFSVENGLVLTKVKAVLHKYNFFSKTYSCISSKRLFYYLLNSSIPVIVSVTGAQSGHLIVLVGVSIENRQVTRILYLDPNNSASHSLVEVTLIEWQMLFNGRALVAYPI